jgi:hypothetical protein
MAEIFVGKRFCLLAGLLSLSYVLPQMNAQAPTPSSGIEGVILVGPIHGGPSRAGVADSAGLANVTFDVTNAAGALTTFTTDESGHFRIPLPPGHYSIKRRNPKKMEHCGPFEVEVTVGDFKKLHWECDSGIR